MLHNIVPQFVVKKIEEQYGQNTQHMRHQQLNVLPTIHQRIQYLDLSSNKFTDIPKQLGLLNLHRLLMKDNLITTIPSFIINWSALNQLDLSNNYIKLIPDNIGRLYQLRILNLNSNLIEELNTCITRLQLKFLGISRNCFTILPMEFGQWVHTLDILELDWLKYVNITQLNSETKQILEQSIQRDVNFNEFYSSITGAQYEVGWQDILYNCSMGILISQCGNSFDEILAPLIFILNQPTSKENQKCMNVLISQYRDGSELLNILFLYAIKKQSYSTIETLLTKQITIDYNIRCDVYINSQCVINTSQTVWQLLMASFNEQTQLVADQMVKYGFDPKKKTNGMNALHLGVKYNNQKAIKWAMQYCRVNSKSDPFKNSCLHQVYNSQYSELIYELAQKRINPLQVNIFNKCPRHFQTSTIYIRVHKEFIKYEKWFISTQLTQPTYNLKHGIITNDHQQSKNDEIMTTISKILRCKFKHQDILKQLTILSDQQTSQQLQMLVHFIILLLLMRRRFGWKFETTASSSLFNTINNYEFSCRARMPIEERSRFRQLFQVQQQAVQSCLQLSEQNSTKNAYKLYYLSQKMKLDISNYISDYSSNELNEQLTLNDYKLMTFAQFQEYEHEQVSTNINVLEQYQQFQNASYPEIHYPEYRYTMIESPRVNLSQVMQQCKTMVVKFKD